MGWSQGYGEGGRTAISLERQWSHKIVNANAKTQATTTLWPFLVRIVFDALSSAQSKYCLIQRTSRKGFKVFHCD